MVSIASVPIVPRPVAETGHKRQNHVVREPLEIEIPLHFLIVGRVTKILVLERFPKVIPPTWVPLEGPAMVDREPIVFGASERCRREPGVRPLAGVIKSPSKDR